MGHSRVYLEGRVDTVVLESGRVREALITEGIEASDLNDCKEW